MLGFELILSSFSNCNNIDMTKDIAAEEALSTEFWKKYVKVVFVLVLSAKYRAITDFPHPRDSR